MRRSVRTIRPEEEEEDDSRFDLPKGTYPIQLVSSELQEKETNPPKRYTQASLIRDMTSIAKYVQDKEIKDILKKKETDRSEQVRPAHRSWRR